MSRQLLLDMLTYCRPAGSVAERAFIDRFIRPLPGAWCDPYDNWHVWIPNADNSPSRIVWSCHTDTVHLHSRRQTVSLNPRTGIVRLSRRSRRRGGSTCLGADCTVGVYLCVSMIVAQVPGHYIFHYGEECGGIGSRALAYGWSGLLADADIAIALDRRGTGDVITHQYGQRTASDVFAWSLAEELGRLDARLVYEPAHGIYTDTAEYAETIPECTNLSVGNRDEHHATETCDTVHVGRLLAALCELDTDRLLVDRDPTAPDPDDWRFQSRTVLPFAETIDETIGGSTYASDNGRAINHEDCPLCGWVAVDGYCTHCGWESQSWYLDRAQADVQQALRRIK